MVIPGKRVRFIVALVAFQLLALAVAACLIDADSADLAGKPCPCVKDAGYQCDEGLKIPRCMPKLCPDDQTLCNSNCVDLKTDLSNCGKCGVVCNKAQALSACIDRTCQVEVCNPLFGQCGDGGCTHVNTVHQCGACGNDCDNLLHKLPDEVDASHECRLGASSALCQCIADRQCGDGARCDAGHCECGPGLAGCPFGEGCDAGLCTCGGGPACAEGTSCCPDGHCYDLGSDRNNCGICGHACAQGFDCVVSPSGQGRCVCGSDAACGAGAKEFSCDSDASVCVCGGVRCETPADRCFLTGKPLADTCM